MSDLETIIQKLVRQELQEQMPGIIARALDEDRRAHGRDAAAAPTALEDRLTVVEAGAVARRSPGTIRLALEGGKLHASQPKKGSRWSVQRQCVLAWVDGDACIYKQNVSPLRPRRPRS